jgi:DNA-binding transcriptional regulator GbsR (MarR family)
MTKGFKPNFLLDEQMYFSDAKTTLAYQLREEVRETNRLLRKLVEQKEAVEQQDVVQEEVENPIEIESLEPPEAKDHKIDKKSDKKGKKSE